MEVHHRLKLAREQRGFNTAREAAAAMGVPVATYLHHEAGTRGIKRSSIQRYAKFYNVSPAWLEFGSDEQQTEAKGHVFQPHGPKISSGALHEQVFERQREDSAAPQLPVVGNLQPGIWIDAALVDERDMAEIQERAPSFAPRWSHLPQFTFVAVGDAADLLRIFKGDYVVCVPYGKARHEPRHKDVVVVERHRQDSTFERTVKQIDLSGEVPELVPRSSDPRYKPVSFDPQTMRESDGTLVRIVGLVIGCWRPFLPSSGAKS